MRYASFERLVLVVGGASVLATIVIAYETAVPIQEVVAQILLLGVLFSAVHWGRRGGFVAAILASVAYVVMRIPLLDITGGVDSQTIITILTRVLTYGLVGILGGELCTRMKYVLAGLEASTGVDALTGIYSEATLARLLGAAQARFERYGERYSVVILEPSAESTRRPTTNRERTDVRHIANQIRSDIRLADEAGRTNDGRFIVLLPNTSKNGAEIVAERLAKVVRGVMGDAGAGQARCIGASEDAEAIMALVKELQPNDAASQASPA